MPSPPSCGARCPSPSCNAHPRAVATRPGRPTTPPNRSSPCATTSPCRRGWSPARSRAASPAGARSTVAPQPAPPRRGPRGGRRLPQLARRRPAMGVRPDPRQRHHRAERRGQQQLGHLDRHQLGVSSSRAATGTPRPATTPATTRSAGRRSWKTSGEVDFVLRKFWDWTKYVGAAGECGVGVTGVWGGVPRSAPVPSLACADGPL